MSVGRRKKAGPEAEFNLGARLREIREAHGLSQRELAERARAPHGQISMIERNHSSPSVASLRKILSGIPMTMAEFFESEPTPRRTAQVFFTPSELIELTSRLSHRNGVSAEGSLSLRQVGDARAHDLQILHEVYEPGADTGASMLEHDASEGGIVVSGEIEVTVGTESRVLKAGDAFLFSSRRPHRFRNLSDRPAIVVSACTPPYL
ncbi:MAG TPA: cupin domain-containing protein [Steroidobacteraceae bacterium]|nr:cupin domain-containing protein [Steroidobacteraceae bacterium]